MNTDLTGYLHGNIRKSTVSTRIDKVAIFKLPGANTEYTEEHGCYWVLTRTFTVAYVLYWDISRALAKIEVSFHLKHTGTWS